MALRNNETLPTGVQLPAAYVKVSEVAGTKESMNIRVDIYADEDTYRAGHAIAHTRYRQFTPSVEDGAPNFIKQGYEFLKLQPGYEYAEDIADPEPVEELPED